MIDLMRSVFTGESRRLSAASLLGSGVAALAVVVFYAGTPAAAAQPEGGPVATEAAAALSPELAELEARVARVTDAWSEAQRFYDVSVAPIKRVLLRYRNDPELAEKVAVALVREAHRAGLEPRLLLAVLLVENPWLNPTIRSPVGAIGLMQVMPVHRGAWRQCDFDLEAIDANICHGAQIFAHYFRVSDGNVERALLRYNGCVNGTNTPDCHQYPYHVFARAGRASLLAWTGTPTSVR